MIKFEQNGRNLFFLTHLELEESLASLKRLLARVKKHWKVPFENVGICGNWESDFSYALVIHYGSVWPKSAHPGKRHPYPIDGSGPLWEGTNRELRIDLMEFIADKLEQLIEEDPR